MGFRIARTLVSVHGRKACPVWNNSDELMTFKYGTPIATVSPIKDIIKSCTDDELANDFRKKPSTPDSHDNRKYVQNLNVLNSNIAAYNNNNNYNNDARRSHTNDARHSYTNDASSHLCD